ncbi:hypothetical protein BU17DRAFT_20807, partial [Hysterangium stoloniferum]
IPSAPYRHAAPSGPWPWQSLDDKIPDHTSSILHTHNTPGTCEGCHWRNYPESLFPNWKDDQVVRSKIKKVLDESGESTIYHIEVEENGIFLRPDRTTVSNETDFEELTKQPTEPRRLRVFCVDNLTVPVMQMLGKKYNIEPFFWTSSVNWIPSRYQENPRAGQDDHITITLKFPRVAKLSLAYTQMSPSDDDLTSRPQMSPSDEDLTKVQEEKDDNKRLLITDFLAIHMFRAQQNSTIITYHPPSEWCATTAEKLHTRISLAGQSVYWQKIFEKSPDPTLVLLSTLWYALYAWDEALETLWEYICRLEMDAIKTNNMELTPELHKIRAHLLHYASLLEDFHESVVFVQETANPAMDSPAYVAQSSASKDLIEKECGNLLIQIKRLKMSRGMWDKRLKNAMHLVFSKVNIEDSKRMQALTKAAVRDSAAMKQISYLTMVFLPASFVAAVFGMNIQDLNPDSNGTLSHYFAAAIPLTIVSTWVIVAYQGQWTQKPNEQTPAGIMRLMWPVMLLREFMARLQDNRSEITAVIMSDTCVCLSSVRETSYSDSTNLSMNSKLLELLALAILQNRLYLNHNLPSRRISTCTMASQPKKKTLANHRHAAPSAPWPWIDITKEIQLSDTPAKHQCLHKLGECTDCWKKYPQSHFPNWTRAQVDSSGLNGLLVHSHTKHYLHYVDVANDGAFSQPRTPSVAEDDVDFWKIMQAGRRAANTRVRAIFVDDPSLSVLKMIGQKYEVEPFFWTSSINWIPARYQEDSQTKQGDRELVSLALVQFCVPTNFPDITIILAFPRATEKAEESMPPRSTCNSETPEASDDRLEIDTQEPLHIRKHTLNLDLLGVHAIRDVHSSTIISYQPALDRSVTSASSIHTRVFLAGQSVYWGNIFKASNDPTFVLLTILWYALFAWDQSLELLWEHISHLEVDAIEATDVSFTGELHQIRAYLLHYASLLEDFKKSVEFILDTPNPAMDAPAHEDNRELSRTLMKRECRILLSQIERLSQSRTLWDKRLTNLMHLAFAKVNIQESGHMKKLTEASLRDSAAMKQIAYLTMVFLPASFVAAAFGMNIQEIIADPKIKGTLAHYVEVAVPFTLVTMGAVMAL